MIFTFKSLVSQRIIVCTERMSLTNTELKKLNNKSYDKPFEVSDRGSISIRVSAKEKIAWQYRYKFNNKAAVRALAYKWVRIVYTYRKILTLYDESKF
jgi:hypothetical protein